MMRYAMLSLLLPQLLLLADLLVICFLLLLKPLMIDSEIGLLLPEGKTREKKGFAEMEREEKTSDKIPTGSFPHAEIITLEYTMRMDTYKETLMPAHPSPPPVTLA
jgi:hypothetical protein